MSFSDIKALDNSSSQKFIHRYVCLSVKLWAGHTCRAPVRSSFIINITWRLIPQIRGQNSNAAKYYAIAAYGTVLDIISNVLLSAAVSAMFVYDIVLTFPMEVKKIWARKFTGLTVLWFLVSTITQRDPCAVDEDVNSEPLGLLGRSNGRVCW